MMKTAAGGRDSAIFSHFNGYRPLGLGQGYPHPELIKEEMQALPGAANSGTCTYSVGYVRKNPFLVYGSGSNVVILNSELNWVQTLTGSDCGYPGQLVSCVDSAEYGGKIAATWDQAIVIFDVSPKDSSKEKDDEEEFPFEWRMVTALTLSSEIHSIHWSSQGNMLLTSGEDLVLWSEPPSLPSINEEEELGGGDWRETKWIQTWKEALPQPPILIKFSGDSTMFATCGKNERLVKIWYQTSPEGSDRREFSFVYIAHPQPVRGMEWRKTSPLMPSGYVPNVLMTSCEDSTCRFWTHSGQPEGRSYYENVCFFLATTIDSQADNILRSTLPFGQSPFIVHWLDNKAITFMQKAGKAFKARSRLPSLSSSRQSLNNESEISIKDTDTTSDQQSDHDEEDTLGAMPERSQTSTTIPRRTSLKNFFTGGDRFARRQHSLPVISTDASESWLYVKSPRKQKTVSVGKHSLPKRMLDDLLNTWRSSSDLVFAIHPLAGSLLIWTVDGLDYPKHSIRVAHTSFTSCIPNVIPPAIAEQMRTKVCKVTREGLFEDQSSSEDVVSFTIGGQSTKQPECDPKKVCKTEAWFLGLLTCNTHGSFNLWSVEQNTIGNHSSISGLIHLASVSGHHGNIVGATPHPLCPILATSAEQSIKLSGAVREVAVWRCDRPGLMHPKDYLMEMCWLTADSGTSLEHVMWFPSVLMSYDRSNLPRGSLLATNNGEELVIFELQLYDRIPLPSAEPSPTPSPSETIHLSSRFGSKGIKQVATAKGVFKKERKVVFSHIFRAHSVESTSAVLTGEESHFYLVIVENADTTGNKKAKEVKSYLKMWSIMFSSEASTPVVGSDSNLPNTALSPLPLPGSWSQSSFVYPNRRKTDNCSVALQLVSNLVLPLSEGVHVVSGQAVCDTSSSAPLQFTCGTDNHAPYLISIVCSNGTVMGWQCLAQPRPPAPPSEQADQGYPWYNYSWRPFLSTDDATIDLQVTGLTIQCDTLLPAHKIADTTPVAMTVAHGGRIALAHHLSPTPGDPRQPRTLRHTEALVTIWECESSGGLVWHIEGQCVLQTAFSDKPQPVHLQWMPLHNGIYVLVSSFGSKLHLHVRKTQTLHEVQQGGHPHSHFSSHSEISQWVTLIQIPLSVYSVLENLSLLALPGEDTLLYAAGNDVRVLPLLSLRVQLEGSQTWRHIAEAIEEVSGALPQYHPIVLAEMMNAGRVTSVKRILLHLIKCLFKYDKMVDQFDGALTSFDEPDTDADSRDAASRPSLKEVGDVAIPRLSLTTLGLLGGTDFEGLSNQTEDTEDTDFLSSMDDYQFSPSIQGFQMEAEDFTAIDVMTASWQVSYAEKLQRILEQIKLPKLDSAHQHQLIALAHTLASASMDIGQQSRVNKASGMEGMDGCGFRYLSTLITHTSSDKLISKSSTSNSQRPTSILSLSSHDFIWAFHSDAESELVASLPCLQTEGLTWEQLREVGLGWWLRSHDVLRNIMERLAKSQFTAKQEPLDAALIYLAMKKQTLLKGLFKTIGNTRLMQFFSNNFSEDRWHKASLKNAFALLTKQRFEESAAFFLLAGKLWDAVEVCLRKLKDLQLAMVITRLYEGGEAGVVYHRILREEVLGVPCDGASTNRHLRADPDPFLRSMAFWLLGSYSEALETLLMPPNVTMVTTSLRDTIKAAKPDPIVFHFYFYLRSHPVLSKRKYLPTRLTPGPTSNCHISSVGNEALTALERYLLFRAAHYYINRGSPLLALDVIGKLPVCEYPSEKDVYGVSKSEEAGPVVQGNSPPLAPEMEAISSGMLKEEKPFDWSKPVAAQTSVPGAGESEVDWSVPVSQQGQPEEDIDWSQPVTSQIAKGTSSAEEEFDWGTPVYLQRDSDTFSETLSIDSKRAGGEDTSSENVSEEKSIAQLTQEPATNFSFGIHGLTKLTRCKLALAVCGLEISNIAELQDIHVIREHIFKWIKEVVKELALRSCCHGNSNEAPPSTECDTVTLFGGVLRTVIDYCRLYAVVNPKLECCSTELVLHFQDTLMVTKDTPTTPPSQVKLHVPVAQHPSQLPLLTATLLPFTHPYSVAKQLHSLVQDLVETIKSVPCPLTGTDQSDCSFVSVVKDQLWTKCGIVSDVLMVCLRIHSSEGSFTLPSWASLTESDKMGNSHSRETSQPNTPKSPRKPGKKVMFSLDNSDSVAEAIPISDPKPNSQPSKWPGVLNWPSLLPSEGGQDPHSLCTLLVESIVPVYLGLLAYAWLGQDTSLVLSLMKNRLSYELWCEVCGGGYQSKGVVKGGSSYGSSLQERIVGRLTGSKKTKLAKAGGVDIITDRTLDGFFIAPKSGLLNRLRLGMHPERVDGEMSLLDEDDASDVMTEEDEIVSYGWALMNLAILRSAQSAIRNLLTLTGIEILELSSVSSVLHTCYKLMEQWENGLVEIVDDFGDMSPERFFKKKGIEESTGKKPSLLVHKSLLDPKSSPFYDGGPQLESANTLWSLLMKDERLCEETFIKYIFKGREVSRMEGSKESVNSILYKTRDNDISISSLCLNMANTNYIAVSTAKEVLELDITEALHSSVATYTEDINALTRSEAPSVHTKSDDEFVLIHASPRVGSTTATPSTSSPFPSIMYTDMDQGTQMLSRPLSGVRKLCSHPYFPYYLTGDSEGAVVMWEFGNTKALVNARKPAPGVGYAITRLRFTPQGNKFAASDSRGRLFMWQGIHSNRKTAFNHFNCHTKSTSDFAFVASSSLLAAAGDSQENKNVSLFDTLLGDGRSSVVREYVCHEAGASAIAYSPNKQCIISGGKKGEICVFDVRQHSLLRLFPAHNGQINNIIINDSSEYFVTGSVDGIIKIWDLVTLDKLHSFNREGGRSLRLFKGDSGISDMFLTPSELLYSASGDGLVRCRSIEQNDD